MPVISMFYGIVVYLYNFDDRKHSQPHIHVKYQGEYCVISIPDCEILAGSIPGKKLNLVKAWISIHEEELLANWDLALGGETPYKIEPLR